MCFLSNYHAMMNREIQHTVCLQRKTCCRIYSQLLYMSFQLLIQHNNSQTAQIQRLLNIGVERPSFLIPNFRGRNTPKLVL